MSTSSSQAQRSVLITGANQGIGYATALELCVRGYHVTIACRNRTRAQDAVTSIKSKVSGCSIDYTLIDLCKLSSVDDCAERLIAEKRTFDVIILNAGVLLPGESRTEDGFDTTFQVNYLSQFLLVTKLLVCGIPSTGVTVVTLTSVLYRTCCCLTGVTRNYDDWWEMFSPGDAKKSGWTSYARSKLATALLARHLNRVAGVRAVAVHPGAVDTSMSTAVAPHMRQLLRKLGIKNALLSAEEASRAVVSALTEIQPANAYRNGRKCTKLSSFALCEQNAIELEKLSGRMINSVLETRNHDAIHVTASD